MVRRQRAETVVSFHFSTMENILLPTGVTFEDGNEPNVGVVTITPCQQGYGTTLGNALRRVLLSSLPGAAVEGGWPGLADRLARLSDLRIQLSGQG